MSTVLLVGVEPELEEVLRQHLADISAIRSTDASQLDAAIQVDWEIDVVVAGTRTDDPVAVAQFVGRRMPSSAMVILCRKAGMKKLQEKIQFTPFISRDTACQPVEEINLVLEAIEQGIGRAQKRRRYHTILQEVRTRMPAQAPARTDRHYLDALLNYAPMAVLLADPVDLSIREWNRHAASFFGVTNTDVRGSTLQEFFPEIDRSYLLQRAARQGAGEEAPDTIRFVRGEEEFFVDLTVAMVSDGEKALGVLVILQDVTPRMRAEAESRRLAEQTAVAEALAAQAEDLRRLNRELEQRNRELEEFSYVATHDLQEPLRKISTFADLVSTDYSEVVDDEGRHYLKRMQTAALRMTQLLRDLLAFSGVQRNGQPFRPVDLNEIVQQVLEDLTIAISESGATIQVDSLPTLQADPVQMRQLFQNLIANAIKFRRPDVPVEIEIHGRLRRGPSGTDLHGQQVVVLEVGDNGIGFDQKYVDKIFNPFQQLHDREKYAGTGIGLAICRRIVLRHGGLITARSRPGKGSTFTVMLPVEHRN